METKYNNRMSKELKSNKTLWQNKSTKKKYPQEGLYESDGFPWNKTRNNRQEITGGRGRCRVLVRDNLDLVYEKTTAGKNSV